MCFLSSPTLAGGDVNSMTREGHKIFSSRAPEETSRGPRAPNSRSGFFRPRNRSTEYTGCEIRTSLESWTMITIADLRESHPAPSRPCLWQRSRGFWSTARLRGVSSRSTGAEIAANRQLSIVLMKHRGVSGGARVASPRLGIGFGWRVARSSRVGRCRGRRGGIRSVRRGGLVRCEIEARIG
jgi:hypothetical protein